MEDEIVLTKSTLRAALFSWEIESRTGKCLSPEESAAMPAEQVADENTDALWAKLAAPAA